MTEQQMRRNMRQLLATTLMAVMGFGPLTNANAATAVMPAKSPLGQPATPIQHLVIIFQENVSFDHYFGTYPHALNTIPGEPKFFPNPFTPSVNGLSAGLLTN